MTKIAINPFVKRQTPESPYTHYTGTHEQLLEITQAALNAGEYTKGYRDGVYIVKVPPQGFYTGLVELKEGDKLIGEYKARREGETPRKSTHVNRKHNRKQPATLVQIILYSHEILAENNDHTSNAPYEIISINGYPTKEEAPIDPDTLMHNHFGSEGGTNTNMTPEEFETQLRKSFNYWKNRALLS